jgi:excinuclease ABC subunit A
LSDVGLDISNSPVISTLSARGQRVKLASFLGKSRANQKILFIFDEPTTGLHFHDIKKLLLLLTLDRTKVILSGDRT